MSNLGITTATESIGYQAPAASVTAKPSAAKAAEDKAKGDDKKKSGKLDLAAIAKQAKALNNK